MKTLEERMALRRKILKEQEEDRVKAKLGTIARKSMKTVGVVTDLARWQGELISGDADYSVADAGNDPE